MKKIYISPQQLLRESQHLALDVIDSGFHPDLILGIWRGGTPVGIALQEVMELAGLTTDHIAIRTKSYSGIGKRGRVRVDGLEYIHDKLRPDTRILLVDDIYDSGLSMAAVTSEIRRLAGNTELQIRIATPWFKPGNNRTDRKPDYYRYANDNWIVFPHELIGLSAGEILKDKPELDTEIRQRLLGMLQQSASKTGS